MSTYSNTAIVFGSLRNALLYFDYVIPVNLGLEVIPRVGDDSHPGPLGLRPLPAYFRDVLPPHLLRNPSFIEQLGHVNAETSQLTLKMLGTEFGFPPRIGGLSDEQYDLVEETAATAFYRFVDDFGLGKFPLDCGEAVATAEMEDDTDLVVGLPALDLVNSEAASWKQIKELRRDKEALDKIRRLRLFAYANYVGKPKSYVEDDILTRISDYDAAVKLWGFETLQGSINMVLTSKVLGGAAAGSLFSSLFGAPTLAAIAALSGGTLEIGRITLEVTKRRFALRQLMRENPVSFVSYAREKLQTKR